MTTQQASNTLTGYGLGVALPGQWEGRIYQRPVAVAPARTAGWSTERSHPVMHLANFALPAGRGDFGTGAVERMGAQHVFIALLEFGADCLGSALYAPRGFPTVQPQHFNPNALQRRIAGQAGYQHFFTERDRPLCLYVVLGAHRQAAARCGQINQVLQQIEVSA
ncbi:MAG: hypothetical protein ACR2N4_04580 [Jatrophihabitans sp.]